VIAEAWIDNTRLHGSPPQSYNCALRSFSGLGTPAPRDNRPTHARRHGAVELTTYYDPRVIELQGYLRYNDEGAAWSALDVLKQQFALNGLTHTLRWRRIGFGYVEQAVVVPGEVMDVSLRPLGGVIPWGISLVCADPRMYRAGPSGGSYDPQSDTFSGSHTLTTGGNFNTPPVITFNSPGANPGLRNDALLAENVLQLTAPSGGAITVDVERRTITRGGVNHPEFLNVSASDFWYLVSGANPLVPLGGAGSVTVTWRDATI